MIRLFKHYIPHAVLLLGIVDLLLLVLAGEFAWHMRASQIGLDVGAISQRFLPLGGFAVTIWIAMIAVGVYGSDALRSMRYACARLLVAISIGIIAVSYTHLTLPTKRIV